MKSFFYYGQTQHGLGQKKNDDLFTAILSLKTKDECARFFRDLCSLEEIADIAGRWQMVKVMLKGSSYREIFNKLKVSTTTVARAVH